MRNLTVTVPEPVLDRLRVLAAEKRLSVNRLVGEILRDATGESDGDWRVNHRALLEEIGQRPRQGEWNRDEIYAERLG